MNPRLEDPVFGTLTFDSPMGGLDNWNKQEHLELIGGSIPLRIHAGRSGPFEEQRQAYRTFKQTERSLRAELQEALFDFYKDEREVYADICSDIEGYVEEFLPILQTSDEIWRLLDPLEWLILGPETAVGALDGSGGKCDTMLFWHGCWDIEHEFGAMFEGGKFLKVVGHGNL